MNIVIEDIDKPFIYAGNMSREGMAEWLSSVSVALRRDHYASFMADIVNRQRDLKKEFTENESFIKEAFLLQAPAPSPPKL